MVLELGMAKNRRDVLGMTSSIRDDIRLNQLPRIIRSHADLIKGHSTNALSDIPRVACGGLSDERPLGPHFAVSTRSLDL